MYEKRAKALAQTALSPVDLATEEDKVPVQQAAVQEFSLVMSHLTPEGQKRTYEEVGPLVLGTLRQGKTKEATTFLSALPKEELHELKLAIEAQSDSEERTFALDLIKRNAVLNGYEKVSIEETATILLEALKAGDHRTACVRVLSRAEREKLREIIEGATETPTDLGIRQAAVPEPHPSQDEALSLLRRENTRTAILMASSPEFLKKQMEQCATEKEKKALADEAQVAVFSLANYAGGRMEVMGALKLLFQENPPQIPHEQLGTFALRWAQAYRFIPLPQTEEDQGPFQRETDWIRERLDEMAQDLGSEHIELEEEGKEVLAEYKRLPEQLRQSAAEFCTTPTIPPLVPGKQKASDLQTRVLGMKRGSAEYKECVRTFSSDLFEASAAKFRSTNPAAMALEKEAADAFSPLINQFNQVSAYVCDSILKQSTLAEAHKNLVFWLDVAEESLRRGDYLTAQAIASGLGSPPISRLLYDANTQKFYIAAEEKNRVDKLCSQFNREGSFKLTREWTEKRLAAHQVVIPFVGVYSTDITFARDGNRDSKGKLKPVTIQLVGAAVAKTQQCLDTMGDLAHNPQQSTDLSTMITECKPLAPKESDAKSLRLRPREPRK